jgi:Tfp pilus assembly protein PilN
MIEINLLPGSTRRGARGGASRRGKAAGAAAPRMPVVNRTLAMIAAGWVVGVVAIAWMHFGHASRVASLDVELEAATRDSARFAVLRAQGDSLGAREAVIAQKLEVIQRIDAGRFIWPHILDEVSRALPPYVWLEAVVDATDERSLPMVQIDGYAGTTFALTRFMEQLEASPFLGGTRLISAEQRTIENRTVHVFMLNVQYREPPPDVIETVPLIGSVVQEN